MAYDYPGRLLRAAASCTLRRSPPPRADALAEAAALLREREAAADRRGRRRALRPRRRRAARVRRAHGVPVAETQAGKGALPWDHPLQQGAIGVTGSPAANALARGRGRRARGRARACPISRRARIRCSGRRKLVNLNVNAFDARKWRGVELVGDAKHGLDALSQAARGWRCGRLAWTARARRRDRLARRTSRASPASATWRCPTTAT